MAATRVIGGVGKLTQVRDESLLGKQGISDPSGHNYSIHDL